MSSLHTIAPLAKLSKERSGPGLRQRLRRAGWSPTLQKTEKTACFRLWRDDLRVVRWSFARGSIGVFVLVLLALTPGGWAFDVTFDVQPRALKLGEAAECTLTIHGTQNAPAPQFPDIPGLQIQSAGRQSSFSMGMGGGGSSITFRYQVLPTKTGKITMGPFQYEMDGQAITLPAVELEVGASDASTMAEMLMARLSVANTNVYNQEVFDLTFSLYSRGINLARDIRLLNMPASGFTLQAFQEIQPTREVVSNQVYDVRRFRGKAQALTAGRFRLEPMLQVYVIVPRERRRSRDPFGMFDDSFFDNPFFGGAQTQPVEVRAEPLELNVQPLPATGQPAGYVGAVGRFNFDVQAKPLDLNAGDPITIALSIAGAGNIEAVTTPRIAESDLFKIYEPKQVSKEISDEQASGRKLFEQVVIPKSDEVKELPALVFSFFDPSRGVYETITRGPFPLSVHPSASGSARMMQAPADVLQPQTLLLGSDIVYLKPSPSRWRRADQACWFATPVFTSLQILPALAVLGLFFAVRRRDELAANVAKARRQKAPRSAQAALRRAEQALKAGKREEFFEALWGALASYFGHRLNLAAGEVSCDLVVEAMTRGRLDPARLEEIRDLFARCEQERFGRGRTQSAPMTEEEKKTCSGLMDTLGEALKACERVRI